MRKSNLLPIGIIIVVIAVLFVVWRLVAKPERLNVDGRGEAAQTEPGPKFPEREAVLESTGSGSRSDVTAERESAVPASMKPELHIQVLYASGLDEHPAGLEVGVSNRLGALFELQQVAPNEFVLVEAPPEVYIVAAKANGFRSTVTHARLSGTEQRTKTTITLQPERIVQVHWRSDDGRPIKVSIADTQQFHESVLLEVLATKFQVDGGRSLDRHALAVLRTQVLFEESDSGTRVAREKPRDLIDLAAIDGKTSTDSFGTLRLDEDGTLWVSAWCGGEWVASLPVHQAQSDVVFVTPLGDLDRRGGTLKLVVVDDVTGQPLQGASLRVHAREGSCISDEIGLLMCEAVGPGRRVGVLKADDHADTILDFIMPPTEGLDLGTLRMETTAPSAHFRVVDEKGAAVAGIPFELIDLGRASAVFPILQTYFARSTEMSSGNTGANLHFAGVQRGRYVLRCMTEGLDAAPRTVEPDELRASAPIAEIVVRPANAASFVLDPPIAKGTQVIIESATGQPLRELDVDMFGVATAEILAGSYRVHLLEYGRATGSVDVLVDSNPFVFEIHR